MQLLEEKIKTDGIAVNEDILKVTVSQSQG